MHCLFAVVWGLGILLHLSLDLVLLLFIYHSLLFSHG
jgi:hypothetical protein